MHIVDHSLVAVLFCKKTEVVEADNAFPVTEVVVTSYYVAFACKEACKFIVALNMFTYTVGNLKNALIFLFIILPDTAMDFVNRC